MKTETQGGWVPWLNHLATEWQSWDANLSLSGFKAHNLFSALKVLRDKGLEELSSLSILASKASP